jgi:hypothetical protein
MDAVILVNDFDQHAPVAISALDRGLNVLSETAAADPMGDGVAEILMLRDFASAVPHQRAPDQDVHFGVELSITGIQAMRSSLAGSLPVEVPDLRRPEVRRAFAADDWFPELPEL